MDNRYISIYDNTDLSGTSKSNLATAKTAYNAAHADLIIAINAAIAYGQTTPAESEAVDTAFTDYSTALATLSTRFEEAVNFIAYTKAQAALGDANDYSYSLYTLLDGLKLNAVINGKTLIVGGYINTDFIDTGALVISGANVSGLGALAYIDALNAAQVGADPVGSAAAAESNAQRKNYSGGKILYRDLDFQSGVNNVSLYNNSGGTATTLNRIARSTDCPTVSNYMIEIRNTGTPTSPGIGGFIQLTDYRANARFIQRLIAKIPVGYYLTLHENAGGIATWLTSNQGTGGWMEYIAERKANSSGAFSSFGHIALNGAAGTIESPVIWYIALATIYDVTTAETDYIIDATAKANAAQSAAIAAAATDATTKANAVNATLTTLSTSLNNDDNVTPIEKSSTYPIYSALLAEKSGLDAQATSFSITTEKTAYDDAITALQTFAATIYSIYSSFTTTTTLSGGDGAVFRTRFNTALTTKQALLTKISVQAKALAEATASADATSKANAAQTAAEAYASAEANTAVSIAQTYTNSIRDAINAAKLDAIVNGNTIIVNGYLNTQFIEAGSIAANQINFDNAVGSNVDLTGKITAVDGVFGNFKITSDYINSDINGGILLSDEDNDNCVKLGHFYVYPGISVWGSLFRRWTNEPNNTYAATFQGSNSYAGYKGYAAKFDGDIEINGGKIESSRGVSYNIYTRTLSSSATSVSTSSNMIVITSASSGSGIHQILYASGSPGNDICYIVNASSVSIYLRGQGTSGSNIKVHGSSGDFTLESGGAMFLVFYGGYWYCGQDFGS